MCSISVLIESQQAKTYLLYSGKAALKPFLALLTLLLELSACQTSSEAPLRYQLVYKVKNTLFGGWRQCGFACHCYERLQIKIAANLPDFP